MDTPHQEYLVPTMVDQNLSFDLLKADVIINPNTWIWEFNIGGGVGVEWSISHNGWRVLEVTWVGNNPIEIAYMVGE